MAVRTITPHTVNANISLKTMINEKYYLQKPLHQINKHNNRTR